MRLSSTVGLSSFCVCQHCYQHCVFLYVPLLEIFFDISVVVQLSIYSKKMLSHLAE